MKSTTALSVARVFRALAYSCNGLATTWRDEPAFRQECALLAVLAPLTLWLQLPLFATVFLFSLMLAVLIVELLNSGLEALVDKTSPEFHALAGKAKDCGSAAVLLAIVALVASWILLAGPALWQKVAN
ncbi:MAG TPA: diacylglycerol kinase [Casimicrobiaceae bacterium]